MIITTHDIMVKLSGVPAGQMPLLLAGRCAVVARLHDREFDGTCAECREPWPCRTYRIVTGMEDDQ